VPTKINRRHFLATVPVTGLAAVNLNAAENGTPNRVKFSVFADIHHYPGVFMSQTPEHLTQIQDRAVREQCDFIIHVGDFTHNPTAEPEFIRQYNEFSIPGYHTLGNHDQDGCAWEESVKAYGMPGGYYSFDKNGFRFIILDPNYIFYDNVYTHYTKSNYYKAPGQQPIIPPDQLEWLKEQLETAPGPCVLFSHQSCEREVGGVVNWREVREIINAANRKHPGRVWMYINGHYHRDFIRILDNVVYFDLNSASYDWVEKTHDCYPKELCDQYKLVNHTVVYNDPVHAVITMDSDGLIKIDGMESSMLYDVTREKAGQPFADSSGRPVYPRVQSANLRVIW